MGGRSGFEPVPDTSRGVPGGFSPLSREQRAGIIMSDMATVKALLLDPLTTIQTTDCPTPVGQALNNSTGKRIVLPCKRWTCPECGPAKVSRLRVRYGLGDLQPSAFLTLTQQTDDPTPIMAAWNRFITSLRRKGWIVRYFLVREYTRKGKAHLHVLVEGYWPWVQTSKLWVMATSGSSKITNIKKIHNAGGAVGYVVKYLTKSLDSQYNKGERRYTASRGALLPDLHGADRWSVYIYAAGRGRVGTGDKARVYETYQDWIRAAVRPFERALDRLPPDDQELLYPVVAKTTTWKHYSSLLRSA